MFTYGLSMELMVKDETGNAAHLDLGHLASLVDRWAEDKLARVGSAKAKEFVFARRYPNEKSLTVLEATLSQPTDEPDSRWVTEVRATIAERKILCTVVMKITHEGPAVAPARYYVETPRLVRSIGQSYDIAIRNYLIDGVPREVCDAGQLSDFIDDLRSASRTAPLVVVTPCNHDELALPQLAAELGKMLFPLARVYEVSKEMTFELTKRLGRELSVFDGGIRIYWPRFRPDDRGRVHDLFVKSLRARSIGYDTADPTRLIRTMFMTRIASASVAGFEYPTVLLDALTEARRQAQTAVAEPSVAYSGRPSIEEFQNVASERDFFRELSEELEGKFEAAKTRIASLEAANDEEHDKATDKWTIESIEQAIKEAQKDFGPTLVFADLDDCESSLPGGTWYHIFKSLHEVCDMEQRGPLGKSRNDVLHERLQRNIGENCKCKTGETGLSIKHPGTGKKLTIRQRAHIKDGAPAVSESLYWEPDDSGGIKKYVVARIGRHI